MGDLSGRKFGALELVEKVTRSDSRLDRPYWRCVCDCGNEVTRRQDYLLKAKNLSCGCLHPRNHVYGDKDPRWKGCGRISGEYFCMIRKGAEKRKIAFSVTKEDLWAKFQEQDERCALSNLPLSFTPTYKSRKIDQTASLDRIDSHGDYTPSNIQWLHKDVQRMKNSLDQKRFLELCNLISRQHPRAT